MPILRDRWISFWMWRSGRSRAGRLATRLAMLASPPYKAKRGLARQSPRGFVSPASQIHCADLRCGSHCYVDDAVVIFDHGGGGYVALGEAAHLYRGNIIEIGQGGSVEIGANSHVQPNCQFTAFLRSIRIGERVQIAPACAFYPYQHGFAPGTPIADQPLQSKGDIVIEDGAWLGYGVVVLDGVTIGSGAIIGAGAVVTESVPAGAIAAGVPARVLGRREDRDSTDAV